MKRIEAIENVGLVSAVGGFVGAVGSAAELMINNVNPADNVRDFFINNPFVVSLILSVAAGGIGAGTTLATDSYRNMRRNKIVAKDNSNIL